jgi:hypothetical protein
VLAQPRAELAGLAGAGEDPGRRALHAVVHHRDGDAAGLVHEPHPAVVAGHERPLGGGQRHVELALGVLPVDEQRAGEADRHLGDADEVLDVAADDRGVEGVARHVLERRAGPLGGEPRPHPRRLARVVVLAVARDGDALGPAVLGHGATLSA